MSKIIVPIDFSSCSKNAFLYARELAQVLNFPLKVIHVYQNTQLDPSKQLLETESTRAETMQHLKAFIDTIPQKANDTNVLTKVKITYEVLSGISVVNTLIEMTKEADAAMVVMGTHGSHNSIQQLLGSVSSALAQQAHCPCVLVPEHTSFKTLDNILYASNYESIEEDMLRQVISFTKVLKAATHFVHVEEGDNYQFVEDTVFNTLFEDGDPNFSFNLLNIKHESVMEALYQYAEENQIDMIVLVNRQRQFMQNLFKMSLTQKMVLNPKFPLLVFHIMKS